ncbi:uncharacterized protein F5891DRAFT_1204109 [Suillus fuscotomentosus]|uniref:Uncharacterized protein n=1 Tax=Suillus fuscotomentosus TaxID=1912939 RepID=A0AAD4DMQ1_9AGAM|nr:uncharacterized protein F5891DRAFT_1204109 [Suillus fuscotomentosus]KAG1882288.1 hypothetical protein F5891DRAFT_1204109 [Suillus fuscotomentosus]
MGVAGWRHISDWPSSPNAWLRGSPPRQAWYASGGATPMMRWGVTLSSFAAWPVELYIEWQLQRPPAIYYMGGQHTDAQWPVELYIVWADHPLSLMFGDGRHSSQVYHAALPIVRHIFCDGRNGIRRGVSSSNFRRRNSSDCGPSLGLMFDYGRHPVLWRHSVTPIARHIFDG